MFTIRWYWCRVLLLVPILVCSSQVTVAEELERPLRILSANIWNRSGPYPQRMAVLRKQLVALKPDLIGFQEADWNPGQRHQVQELLEGLDYQIEHEADETDEKRHLQYAVAVASRWPVRRQALWRLPGSVVALAVEVEAPQPAGKLLFISTVGTSRWQFDRELDREKGAVALDEKIRATADPNGFPPIVVGDFDATPQSASIRYLSGLQSLAGCSTHYFDAWNEGGAKGPGYTWSTRNPYVRQIADKAFWLTNHHRRIDYIFLGSPHHYRRYARVVSCRLALNREEDGVWPSDHFGVYAEITARKESP